MEQRRYIDSAATAELLGVTERAVRKRIASGEMTAESITGCPAGGGGVKHLIPLEEALEAAPVENRLQWYEQQSRMRVSVTGADLTTYAERLGPEALEVLARRQQAVLAVDGVLGGAARGKIAALEEIASQIGCSPRTLRRWHAAYVEGGLAAIMDKVERKDKGKPKTLCSLAQNLVETYMCDERKLPQNLILENLRGIADTFGDGACNECPYCPWSDLREKMRAEEVAKYPACDQAEGRLIIPESRYAINRFVKSIPEAQLHYARYGKRAWEAKYMQKAVREKPKLINAAWFGDHKMFDLVVLTQDGKLARPWLTAWMDATSGEFVGVYLTLHPNSDTIAESFARAAVYTVGSDICGLPTLAYMDNGLDYRSARFEGDKWCEYEVGKLNAQFYGNGMLKALGVQTKHAKAYRGWSKTIERAFQVLDRWIRLMPGWIGGSIGERPEDSNRKIKAGLERGEIMTFETFARCFYEDVLPKYRAFKGEDGLSPQEIYQGTEKARYDIPDWPTMALLKSMHKDGCAVYPQGVRFQGVTYWHPALEDYIRREPVTLLYSRGYNPSVTVMHDGKFVCEATPKETLRMIDEEPERVGVHIAQQKAQERKVTSRIRQIRQTTKKFAIEAYAEAIDEQRTRQAANVVSLEARKASAAKEKVAAQAAGTHSSSRGKKVMYDMLVKEGERLINGGA